MPVSFRCLEEKNGVNPEIARFALPIALVINKNGTNTYMIIAVIFIAQLRNVVLSLGQIVAVAITGTIATMSAPSVPQSGLVVMVMVLNTVALPAEEISIIVAIDWLL